MTVTSEDVPETTAQRDERVRLAEEDRAKRRKVSPLTGVLTHHDVLRHLATNGPARSDAEREELLGVINEDDPDYQDPEAGEAFEVKEEA